MIKIFISIFLFFILNSGNFCFAQAFYFHENTLYWCEIGEKCNNVANFLRMPLDKKLPSTINKEEIKSIWVKKDSVLIFTENFYWILNYEGESLYWYIKGPYEN